MYPMARSTKNLVYLTWALSACLAGCASTQVTTRSGTPAPQASAAPQFVHCVFFNFKPEVTEDQIDEFVRDCGLLKQIPAVKKLDAGRRDTRMQREMGRRPRLRF
jgi:hypothetical protein